MALSSSPWLARSASPRAPPSLRPERLGARVPGATAHAPESHPLAPELPLPLPLLLLLLGLSLITRRASERTRGEKAENVRHLPSAPGRALIHSSLFMNYS